MLEWNSHCMQNLSHDTVCKIIAASRHDSKLELIVSRAANVPGNDDFLNIHRILSTDQHIPTNLMQFNETNFNNTYYPQFDDRKLMHLQNAAVYSVPHSQSLINAPLNKCLINSNNSSAEQNFLQRHYHNRVAQLHGDLSNRRAESPLVLHRNFQTRYSLVLFYFNFL